MHPALKHPVEFQAFPGEKNNTDIFAGQTVKDRRFYRHFADDDHPLERIDRDNPFPLPVDIKRQGIAVKRYIKLFPVNIERSHRSSDIEICRVFWLHRAPQQMGPAPAVHLKDMHPVLGLCDKPCEDVQNILHLTVGKKTLIGRLLPARAVALQKIPHLAEPLLARDIVGDEIKRPVHKNIIKGSDTFVSKRNIAEILFFQLSKSRRLPQKGEWSKITTSPVTGLR